MHTHAESVHAPKTRSTAVHLQVLRGLPAIAISYQHSSILGSAFSRGLTTSWPAAQQHAQQEASQHQHDIAATQSQSVSPPQQQSSAGPAASTSTTPLLAFDEVYVSCRNLRSTETPSPQQLQQQQPITAVFLHGLLGSSRNWRSFSRKLAVDAAAKANRDVRVLLLDVRCHGDSAARFGFHPPHDMAAAATDVTNVIQHELQGQAPHLLVGLSLGGKIALQVLKQLVAAQEAALHQQQHLYKAAPPIMPPEDQDPASSSSNGSSSSNPPLRGVPQQVGGVGREC